MSFFKKSKSSPDIKHGSDGTGIQLLSKTKTEVSTNSNSRSSTPLNNKPVTKARSRRWGLKRQQELDMTLNQMNEIDEDAINRLCDVSFIYAIIGYIYSRHSHQSLKITIGKCYRTSFDLVEFAELTEFDFVLCIHYFVGLEKTD